MFKPHTFSLTKCSMRVKFFDYIIFIGTYLYIQLWLMFVLPEGCKTFTRQKITPYGYIDEITCTIAHTMVTTIPAIPSIAVNNIPHKNLLCSSIFSPSLPK